MNECNNEELGSKWCEICRRGKITKYFMFRHELPKSIDEKLFDGRLAMLCSSQISEVFVRKSNPSELLHQSKESYFIHQDTFLYNKQLNPNLKAKFDRM